MRALVEAAHQARRKRVARVEDEHVLGARPLGSDDAGEPREAAAAFLLAHLVDVVHEHEREPHRVGRGGAAPDEGLHARRREGRRQKPSRDRNHLKPPERLAGLRRLRPETRGFMQLRQGSRQGVRPRG